MGLLRSAIRAHLLATGMGEDAAVLEDEQGLDDAWRVLRPLLRRRPPQRLQLHLPVDSCEAAAVLQHRLPRANESFLVHRTSCPLVILRKYANCVDVEAAFNALQLG